MDLLLDQKIKITSFNLGKFLVKFIINVSLYYIITYLFEITLKKKILEIVN